MLATYKPIFGAQNGNHEFDFKVQHVRRNAEIYFAQANIQLQPNGQRPLINTRLIHHYPLFLSRKERRGFAINRFDAEHMYQSYRGSLQEPYSYVQSEILKNLENTTFR